MSEKIFTERSHRSPKVDFSNSPSLSRQEFKDEADVNNLLKRYQLTGDFYDPLKLSRVSAKPLFGDFTHFTDFQACQNALIEAQNAFSSLPVKVRQKFGHDPAKLIEWLADDANREEAIELGLIEKPSEEGTPEPAKGGQPATEPASEKPAE